MHQGLSRGGYDRLPSPTSKRKRGRDETQLMHPGGLAPKLRTSIPDGTHMPYADRARQNEFNREWQAKRRREWFATHPCVVCGATDDLELHHRDRTQKVSHCVWSWSEERRLVELAKCDSLCHKHHLDATAMQFSYYAAPHGTHHRYSHLGCRCRACKDAHAVMNRKYRKPKGTTVERL